MSLSFNFPISPNQELFANEVGDKFFYTLPAIPGNYTVLLLNLLTKRAHYLSIGREVVLNYIPAIDTGRYVFFIFESNPNIKENLRRDNFTEQIKLTELGKVVVKIPFTIIKSLLIPGDIRRRAAEDLSVKELEVLCESDSIFNQQTCQNPAFLRRLINKYLISDPVKAEEYYQRNPRFNMLKYILSYAEEFVIANANSYPSRIAQLYDILADCDIPMKKIGTMYPSPFLYVIRFRSYIGKIIPFLTQNNIKLVLKNIFEGNIKIYNFDGDVGDLIAALDDATFNDLIDKSIKNRNLEYFQLLLINVLENEREQFQRMYDEYNGPRINYPDLPENR
jgi:hypothetical protein